QFGKIPNAEFQQIEIKVSQSAYVESSAYIECHSSEFKLLEAKKFNMVVKRGKVISGVVRDMRGRAIADATVTFGASIYVDDFVKITTDSAGRFLNDRVKTYDYNYEGLEAGCVLVTVTKAGYAPDMKIVRQAGESEQLEFVLEDGYTIRGRVVDVNGKRVEGVTIGVSVWRGIRIIEWKGTTDSQGRFHWDDAPADEVKFDFYKKGYSDSREEPLVSSEEEHEIVLYPPLKISGRVTDAQTGETIKNFDITNGIDWLNGSNDFSFEKQTKKNISDPNGKYEIEITNDYPARLLKIEADGYVTAISKAFKTEDMVVSYDFKLIKAEPLDVVVKLADGSIAENAQVIVVAAGGNVSFQDGFYQDYNREAIVMSTDADGRFSLSNQPENFSLVINHDKGYLIVPGEELAGLKEIVLARWGTIQGYVYKGDSPVAEQNISVYCNQMNNSNDNISPRINYSLTAVTDANGFFEVKKIIPAKQVQCSWVKKINRTSRNLVTEFVEVLPGGVSEVEFLIQGRAVTGRLIIPDSSGDVINYQRSWLSVNSHEVNGQDGMSPVYREVIRRYTPDGFDKMTVAERMNWADDFQKSGDAEQVQKEIGGYSKKTDVIETRQGAVLNNDGTFFIEGLSCGKWEIIGSLAELNKDSSNSSYKYIPISFDIEVPEVDGLYDDRILNVGDTEVVLSKSIKLVGKTCPEFSAETADGKKVGLTDYRGKYLILNVLALGNLTKAMVEQLNGLKEHYCEKNIEILTLSYESDYSTIVKLGEEIQIDWPVVYVRMPQLALTDYNVFDIIEMFGLDYQTPSMNFIVSPEGEILKASADFSEIGNALEDIFVSP
ncbi:MAG TPA: redoxin domain-containing protein, partial [Sedimentisphaerales bacterium]|nr:redoxin domain-containing protein [Sedimentisphaerales bacterium]